ncbi:unnamed protein product [Symbiodinium sp. CCMP2592]|nr:unnamed protein product [Symbiodinium sp. CCMP2592]
MARNMAGDLFLASFARKSILEGLVNFGSGEMIVLKYSASLVRQWGFQYGSQEHVAARGVALTSGGDMAVAGETLGSLFPPHNGDEDRDVFIMKFPATDGITTDTFPAVAVSECIKRAPTPTIGFEAWRWPPTATSSSWGGFASVTNISAATGGHLAMRCL